MSDYAAKQRHVIGVLGQTRVLFWKNSLLFRRNISGTLAEILVAILFVLILLLVRYFADTTHIDDQTSANNPIGNVVDFVDVASNRSKILYYPVNDFVKVIVIRALNMINGSISRFNRSFNVNGN